MSIKELISKEVDIPLSMIEEALSLARVQVKKFFIKKQNGSNRLITQPSRKLKIIQYWLIKNIFDELPVHDAAIAYRNGKSILYNAALHRENRYFLRIDLENFFPSINYSDLAPIVKTWHKSKNIKWKLSELEEIIRLACFYVKDALAVGYPSSPIISNIVMMEFDKAVSKLIKNKTKYGDVVYTRYADDLVFSTNKKGVYGELLKEISKLITSTSSPKISINKSKTKIGSSSGGSASVTGLKICNDGHITLHRHQKDHIRLLLSLFKKGKLKDEERNSLLGHLAYVYHVDTAFYTKLNNKYFNEISELKALTP